MSIVLLFSIFNINFGRTQFDSYYYQLQLRTCVWHGVVGGSFDNSDSIKSIIFEKNGMNQVVNRKLNPTSLIQGIKHLVGSGKIKKFLFFQLEVLSWARRTIENRNILTEKLTKFSCKFHSNEMIKWNLKNQFIAKIIFFSFLWRRW